MQPLRLDLYRYELPLRHPLPLKTCSLDVRQGVLLHLHTSDGVGWGDAAPLPDFSRESLEEVTEAARSLTALLSAHSLPADPGDPDDSWYGYVDGLDLPAALRFGLELAICNVYADRHDVPPPALFSEYPAASIQLNELIADPAQPTERLVAQLRGTHCTAVKVKVGRTNADAEIRLIHELRRELPSVALRLDANRAWPFDEAIWFLRQIEDCAIDYIEEPLREADRMPELAASCSVPLALDESVSCLSAADLADYDYAEAVVLKPTLLGGVARTIRLVRMCRSMGIRPVITGAYEAGPGTLGLIGLAAGLTPEVPVGLTTYRQLNDDVMHPRLPLDTPHVDVTHLFETRRTLNPDVVDPL